MPIFGDERLVTSTGLGEYILGLDNLIGYWPLNEAGRATNIASATRGSFDGTNTDITLVDGQVGKAYSFDGDSSKVTISDDSRLKGFSEVSWVFMLSVTSTAAYKKVIKSGVYDVGISNLERIFSEYVGVTNGNLGEWDSTNLGDDTWRIYAFTYDGTNLTGYRNGSVIKTASNASGNLGTNAGDLVFGVSGTEWYSGLMQHMALFNRGLTSNEVTKLTELAGLS